MAIDRRTFLKRAAAAAAAAAAYSGFFIPFSEAIEVPRFNFAHITDLHLDVKGESSWQYREKSIPLFIDALRQLGRLPRLNFVVFGGDQIHYGPRDRESLDVFQQWIAQLDMPCYILLGNTEVSPIHGVSKTGGRDDYLKAWSGMGLRPGQSSWVFDPVRQVRVIGFDVTVDGKPYGEAGARELKWLENELKAGKAKKLIIIFTHHLLMPTAEKDEAPEWSFWMVRNHAHVRELLEGFPNVRLVVSGHHHVSRVKTAGRITYVADPAVVTYPCSIRAFSVAPAGIHLKNMALDDRTAVSRAKELLESDPLARLYDPNSPQNMSSYSMGLTEQDRETTIQL